MFVRQSAHTKTSLGMNVAKPANVKGVEGKPERHCTNPAFVRQSYTNEITNSSAN